MATDTADAESAALVLRFAARVGSEPFSCTSTYALGSAKTTVEPLDFRLYVHNVRLVRADKSEVPLDLVQDGTWQHRDLALLDFEDKSGTCANGTTEVNTTLRARAVAGAFTGIRLTIGVPFALNHGDTATAPSPLNLSALFWTWNAGYKFARIDLQATAPIDAAFNIHLGSTGCTGEASGGGVKACSNPNRGEVALDGFDPTSKTILVDLAKLVETTDLSRDGGGAPGCMSEPTDPECLTVMPGFGLDATSGAPSPTAQKLFRVE